MDRIGSLSTDEEEFAIEEKLRHLPPPPVGGISKSRSAYSSLSGSATHKPKFDCGQPSSSEDEDSDAEFSIHPSLRGMTKTRSEYSVPRIKAQPSHFELNLSRMLRSTDKWMRDEAEAPVPSFTGPIDNNWPEPDDPSKKKRKTTKTSVSCWSSPPNLLDDGNMGDELSLSDTSAVCWSAPEMMNDYDGDDNEEEDDDEEELSDDFDCPEYVRAYIKGSEDDKTEIFSDSYPVIDTTDPESSNTHTPCNSRPDSPLFDAAPPKPICKTHINEPNCELGDSLYGEECRPTQDLPLSRHRLLSSDSAPNLSVLSTTSIERSAESILDDEERKQFRDREDWIERGSCMQLYDYDTRDMHSIPIRDQVLGDPLYHSDYTRSNNDFYETAHAVLCGERTGELRRSTTTDAFKRSRRRLPQRPDHAVGYHEHLPTSISMYERSIRDYEDDFDYRCGTAAGYGRRGERGGGEDIGCRQGSIRSLREEHMKNSKVINSREVLFNSNHPQPSDPLLRSTEDYERELVDTRLPLPPPPSQICRPPDLPVRSHHDRQQTIIRPLMPMHGEITPSFSELKTPISPNVVPSPTGTGRRLPPLPLSGVNIVHHTPQYLYHHPPRMTSTKEEHRLCYGMDHSGLIRSTNEYEEDGINGNSVYGGGRKSFFSMDDSSGVSSCTNSDHSAPTHRVQSSFHARHHDEVSLEIGDAVRIDRQFDDHWSQGTNLRSGQTGIFPSAVVCEIDIIDEICQGALPTNATKILTEERDTFYLTMLASIEVGHHKGNDVLVQAMNKVLSMYKKKEEIIVPQTVLMEISFRGIHIIDKKKKNFFQCPSFDFFYSLQNISFCGAHPKQLRYFGFITKHPLLPRFACHVFLSNESTQAIVEAIGRAFKRSYDEYMAFAHPTEDIYLE